MAIDEKSGWARAFLGGLAHLWRKSHAVDADGAALFRSYCGVLVSPSLFQAGSVVTSRRDDGVLEGERVVDRKCGNCERMLDAWRAEVLVPGMRELADEKARAEHLKRNHERFARGLSDKLHPAKKAGDR